VWNVRFVWDSRKAAANRKKHRVSFEEAQSALTDRYAVTGSDPDHSFGEFRWITFGTSTRGRLIVVSHTDERDTIRIINARLATRPERKLYEEDD
jgi:uncharacterized DUF497 family protein